MTLEEALAASEAEPVNDIFTVNPQSRTITVPAGAKTLIIAGHSDYLLPALSKVRQ